MPTDLKRELVVVVDADGNLVGVVTSGGQRRLAVDAFVSGGGAVGTVFTHTASQNLALAALDTVTAFASTHRPSFVAIVFRDGAGVKTPLPAQQTLTISYDSGDGPNFDTIIERIDLPAGTEEFVFAFPDDTVFDGDDETRVQLTNTGTPAITAHVTVRAQD